MSSTSRRANFAWLVAYLAAMSLLVWLLILARGRVVQSLSGPAATAHWQEWKDEVQKQHADPSSPIRRRPPKGSEPPGLVLMRDHFAAVITISLVIGTILFGFFALVARGMFGNAAKPGSAHALSD